MLEIWVDVKDFEGLYQVSNFGRVKSLARKTNNQYGREDRILKTGWCKNRNGKKYYFVYLSKNGTRKKYLLHRLVAETFIPNPNNLPQVNHKDENPSNNCVDNLEWCASKYNINYGTRNNKVRQKLSIPVKQYTKDGVFVAKYPSAIKAEEETKINSQNISRCRAGNLPSAGGYI